MRNIINPNTTKIRGKQAITMNITAIEAVAESIRTTYGPKGLNKLLIDPLGDLTITSDGAKVLEEMSIENPAAKMVVNLSKTIQKRVGDGSISSVLFLSELMKNTEEMLSMQLPPAIIKKGYGLALKEIKRIINSISITKDLKDTTVQRQIVTHTINTKYLINATKIFTEIIVKAIQLIAEEKDGKIKINEDNIQIIRREGEALSDSQLLQGIIIDKEIVNLMMPKHIENAKIALIDSALEIIKTDYSSEINISSPDDISNFLQQENTILKNYVDNLKSAGVNVVFCQKGIEEAAQHYLSKQNILAVRRVKHSDMKKLSHATGASIITNIKTIQPSDLGYAKNVFEKKIGKDTMVFVNECKDPKAITILIRGTSEEMIDDAKRSLQNGLRALKTFYQNNSVVPGLGAVDTEIRKQLITYSQKIGGKEQIAIEYFANALEIFQTVIIENSGKNAMEILTELKTKVDFSKKEYIGYDIINNQFVDAMEQGFLEVTEIKKQIITLATDLAMVFIRIDDYIKIAK